MRALGQQPAVDVLQQRAEPVGIVDSLLVIAPADLQLIAERIFAPRHHGAEEAARVVAVQLRQPPAGLLLNQPNLGGVRQQRTHLQTVIGRMHAKQSKGIGVMAGDDLINHVTIGKYRHSLLP